VHWPRGIKAKGEVRTQYAHIIDIVPTVVDVLGIDANAWFSYAGFLILAESRKANAVRRQLTRHPSPLSRFGPACRARRIRGADRAPAVALAQGPVTSG
jgi:arylsulfatase A-like enzyme